MNEVRGLDPAAIAYMAQRADRAEQMGRRGPARLLRESVVAALDSFDVESCDTSSGSRAAVCVVLIDRPFEQGLETCFVLTRRGATLKAHAHQWALPGGRLEDGESPEQAALRELKEEVGIDLAESAVIGRLDDYVTRSGFRITPVVAWAGEMAVTLAPQSGEVESIHLVPIAEIDVEPRFVKIDESSRPVIQVPLFGAFIHAPTGAILHQLREVALHGRCTRVAHFEQPVFAWR